MLNGVKRIAFLCQICMKIYENVHVSMYEFSTEKLEDLHKGILMEQRQNLFYSEVSQ